MNQDRVIMEMEELYESLADKMKSDGDKVDDGLGNGNLDDSGMDICGGSDGG